MRDDGPRTSRRRGWKFARLAAGGNRIRTIGPAPAKGTFGLCQSETAARKAEPLTGSGPKRQCLPGVAGHSLSLSWRDREFESVFLQGRVHKPSVPPGCTGRREGGEITSADWVNVPVVRQAGNDYRSAVFWGYGPRILLPLRSRPCPAIGRGNVAVRLGGYAPSLSTRL
jgi:hypothetical protein